MADAIVDVENKKDISAPVVLFEDDAVLVVNKPEGWLTHEDGKSDGQSVAAWFIARVPEATGVGEETLDQSGNQLDRSGIVHRLDRETSGVLVLAKTQVAYDHLKLQFQDRLVKKEYRAFVYGRINDRWATINRAIGRSPTDPRKRSAMPGAKGVMREAITDFERIGVGEYNDEAFSYVKLVPKTGRTHQLRVHLKAVDRPIVGDTLYAEHLTDRSNHLACDRLMLHAHTIELTLPNGTTERFIAPLPQIFEEAAERIEGEVEVE